MRSILGELKVRMSGAKLKGCWSEETIAAYLGETMIPVRLAVQDITGSPWVMSLWFEYAEGGLWCATNAQSRLVTYLQVNPSCGFEVAADQPPYRGVRGKGTATIVPERGMEILQRLLKRYAIEPESSLARSLLAKSDQEVAIRIAPSRISSWDFTERMKGALSARPT